MSIPNEKEIRPRVLDQATLSVLASPFRAEEVEPRTRFTSWEIFRGRGRGGFTEKTYSSEGN